MDASGEGEGQYRLQKVEGTDYWVQDKLKHLLYTTGNIASIL